MLAHMLLLFPVFLFAIPITRNAPLVCNVVFAFRGPEHRGSQWPLGFWPFLR